MTLKKDTDQERRMRGHVEEGTLEALARRAVAGDSAALERLCDELYTLVYRLSLRFFASPSDAQDVTQEIMIKVVTNLGSFEGRSKLTTWVYTIATRHLMRTAKRASEREALTAAQLGEALDSQLLTVSDSAEGDPELELLAGEVRFACTYGMLLCLSRDLRLAYVLAELCGFTDVEGAEALEITPTAFRQRLARARRIIRGVVAGRCGLAGAQHRCRCTKQARAGLRSGMLDPTRRQWSVLAGQDGPIDVATIRRAAEQADAADALVEIYRSEPALQAPEEAYARLRRALPDLLA